MEILFYFRKKKKISRSFASFHSGKTVLLRFPDRQSSCKTSTARTNSVNRKYSLTVLYLSSSLFFHNFFFVKMKKIFITSMQKTSFRKRVQINWKWKYRFVFNYTYVLIFLLSLFLASWESFYFYFILFFIFFLNIRETLKNSRAITMSFGRFGWMVGLKILRDVFFFPSEKKGLCD